MRLKAITTAALLMSPLLSYSALAQYGAGYGLYGGNQPCGYQQPSAPPEDKQVAALQKEEEQLKKDRTEDRKRVRELERERSKLTTAISDAMASDWAQAVIEHLDKGYNCSCGTRVQDAPPADAAPDGDPQPTRRHRRTSEMKVVKKTDRSPASADPLVDTGNDSDQARGNPYDRTWFGGQATGGGQLAFDNCAPPDALHDSQPWKTICQNGGSVTKAACHNHYFANPGVTGDAIRGCDSALDRYAKVNNELISKTRDVEGYAGKIAAVAKDLRERKKEVAREQKEHPKSSTNFNWASLIPLGLGAAIGGFAEYNAYQNNKANNTILSREGFPTQPYAVGSAGYPFLQAGLYGSIASMQAGAYGCGGSVMPGMPNGTMGMPGFQAGGFQGYNPAYQSSLYGGGYPGGLYPGYLGLGQSLTPATVAPISVPISSVGSTVYTGGR